MSRTAGPPSQSAMLLHACLEMSRRATADGKAPVCLAVADRTGVLQVLYRMEGAPERLVAIATAKAYTAARMGISTAAFRDRLERERLTLADFCDAGFTSLPGGIPVTQAGQLAGAVGVSGRSLEDDAKAAQTLVRLIDDMRSASPAH